ncbi:Fatty acid oxidation complex subunit alpha [Achromobacter insolitus]|uniref:3-hydroxyacyl-CoA dehydrogenase NAD-binding domain-containing protein n=1 Tax=Achromobacter insolitus TaxID=217204 RepID=UPI000972C242|nr:3-hydroxyacyl-CoA dehydrogenase NAD-binding domain-containing protein [Achromobacter insolitus]APX74821.1 3-hydroxyacyl-CoA dehydrogenase [Achromobacter insolitus]OWT55425.1 3-hydroxyacyl-CoA dehydrogenase [Achromobacter insolitus]CAB3731212.1 Fatty acid oxidation complex subunit alpha [Achromobacter insolitus]VEG68042.1 Fatty acid oxidation complex subunit alpha [Achromobacter insolitus]
MTDSASTGAASTRRYDDILVVTIDHPPVNALSAAVRGDLARVIREAQADPQVRAVLLMGAGKNFIAGADIREFGKPPQAPILPEVCNQIEASAKPVVAVLHGAALGGGLEIAMAAHYRVALEGAKLGLPEVNLGLLPGAGGTQRAPRLMGAQASLDLMLTGKHLSARAALEAGLVDTLSSDADPLDAGLAYTRQLLAVGAGPRRSRDAGALADKTAALAQVEAAAERVAATTRGLYSPAKIVEAVRAAIEQPFDEGLRTERALFLQCLDSPQRAGLIHAFFAERDTAKMPGQPARPRRLERIGIVGGGTMGAGIAVAALDAGFPVTMVEQDDPALERGRARVAQVYDLLLKKGRLTPQERESRLARFTGATDYGALDDADLIIEAVFEDMAVKQAVFAQLDRVAKPGAVLATNTSYLDVDRIAAATRGPADVLGLHFFSPANIMKLLEVVVGEHTAADTVATGFELARRLRKIPVRAGVCDGFIGNRILAVHRQAADMIMEDGASPYEIDAAVRAFGYPMGPYQMADLAGGDIGWATRKRRAPTRDPAQRYVQIPDRLCERGWFGQKTGRGFYLYPDGARQGEQDPEVLAIIAAERARARVTPRSFTPEDIQRRYLAAMINEAANVLLQGIAQRPSDIDVVFLAGYGFPRHRGGPMHYADSVGLDRVLADIRGYAQEDPAFWKPSPLLVQLADSGRNFASLNQTA